MIIIKINHLLMRFKSDGHGFVGWGDRFDSVPALELGLCFDPMTGRPLVSFELS